GAGDVELGALDAEHPSGVINQAPRAKLGQGEKPRSADHTSLIALTVATAAGSRHPSHEWQAREVVAGQESLAGEIAERVEVAVLRIAGLEQQLELILRIEIASIRVLAFAR